MEIYFTRKARKQIRRLDKQIQIRIDEKIRDYAANPTAQSNNVTALTGTGENRYRLRVGDYRVLFRVDDGPPKIMFVYRVAHRKEAYHG